MKRTAKRKAPKPHRYCDHEAPPEGTSRQTPPSEPPSISTALRLHRPNMNKVRPPTATVNGPPSSRAKKRIVSLPTVESDLATLPIHRREPEQRKRAKAAATVSSAEPDLAMPIMHRRNPETRKTTATATVTSTEAISSQSVARDIRTQRDVVFHSSSSDSDSASADSESEDNQDILFPHPTPAADHTRDLLGGNGVHFYEPLSTSLPSLVPLKIQKKIWRHKFIDLAQLLPSEANFHQSQTNFAVQLDRYSNLTIVPRQKSRKITTIESWTTAFLRFVAIYSVKFPSQTPALMKYMEIVRDLAAKRPGLAFATYDSQFRMLRESAQFPWDRIHMEYWLLATTEAVSPQLPFRATKGQSKRPRHQSNGQRTRFLPQTCWTYNRRSVCDIAGCPHPHVCGLCRGKHPAAKCHNSKEPLQHPSARPTGAPAMPGPYSKTNKR